jgi:hypothetical protein
MPRHRRRSDAVVVRGLHGVRRSHIQYAALDCRFVTCWDDDAVPRCTQSVGLRADGPRLNRIGEVRIDGRPGSSDFGRL